MAWGCVLSVTRQRFKGLDNGLQHLLLSIPSGQCPKTSVRNIKTRSQGVSKRGHTPAGELIKHKHEVCVFYCGSHSFGSANVWLNVPFVATGSHIISHSTFSLRFTSSYRVIME